MDWLGDGVNGPLVIVRAVHFAATAITAGSLIFRAAVAEPTLRLARVAATGVQMQIRRVAWIGLAVAMASGALWVFMEAAAMSGFSLKETMSGDVLLVVVNETQFGLVSEIRLALALTLTACLTYDRYSSLRWLGLASALGLVAVAVVGEGSAAREPALAHPGLRQRPSLVLPCLYAWNSVAHPLNQCCNAPRRRPRASAAGECPCRSIAGAF